MIHGSHNGCFSRLNCWLCHWVELRVDFVSNLVRISLTCCRCLPLRLPMIIRRFLVACAVTSQALLKSMCRMSSCARLCTGVLEKRNVCVFVTKGYKFKDIFGDFVFERFQKLLMKYQC